MLIVIYIINTALLKNNVGHMNTINKNCIMQVINFAVSPEKESELVRGNCQEDTEL